MKAKIRLGLPRSEQYVVVNDHDISSAVQAVHLQYPGPSKLPQVSLDLFLTSAELTLDGDVKIGDVKLRNDEIGRELLAALKRKYEPEAKA